MGQRIPIPELLRDGAFAVADARALGIGTGRLSGPDLARPFHGVRSTDPALAPALAVLPLLHDGDRLSHTTAAEVRGVPLPRSAEGIVHVTAGLGRVAPRIRGVVGHSDDGRGVDLVAGIPLSHPGELFLELAGLLRHDALVAAGDHLVHSPRFAEPYRPFIDLGALADACAEPGRRHVRRARAALVDVRMGVASPRETRLRLSIVRGGLPEPDCDVVVHDVLGDPIGWFDLVYPHWRVIVEYDGEQHRTSTKQYDRDQRRFELAAEAGWITIRVRTAGLRPGPGLDDTLARIARALRSRGWRP